MAVESYGLVVIWRHLLFKSPQGCCGFKREKRHSKWVSKFLVMMAAGPSYFGCQAIFRFHDALWLFF